jgi:hypothetical protein
MTVDILGDHRPHAYGFQLCLECRDIHMAVWPVSKPMLSECPRCGKMACFPWPQYDREEA